MNRTNFLPSLFKGMFTNESRSIEWSEVAEIICGESLKSLTEKYRKLVVSEMPTEAQKIKQRMPVISPAVQCDGGRKKEHFVGLTGVSLCDFDHLQDIEQAFKIACADSKAFLVYRTISGKGLRILFKVECPKGLTKPEESGNVSPGFYEGNEHFAKLLSAEADMKCKNLGRLSVLCHDANAYFNPNAEAFTISVISNNKGKCQNPALMRAVKAITKRLDTEGVNYEEGSYNKYVMRFGYYLNSLGVLYDDAVVWAVKHFNDYDEQSVQSIFKSCYSHTDEFGKMRVQRLESNHNDSSMSERNRWASIKEIEEYLRQQGAFRYNVITRKTEFSVVDELTSRQVDEAALNYELRSMNYDKLHKTNNELDGLDEFCKTNNELHELNQLCKTNNSSTCSLVNLSTYRELTDRDVNSLWSAMSKTGVNVKLQHLYSVLCSDFVPEWNPFEDYFYSLPEWDGTTDYIAMVAEMVTVNEDFTTTNYTNLTNLNLTPIPSPKGEGSCNNLSTRQHVNSSTFTSCFRKWLVGMVASLLDENVVNNTILVLVGKQGIYKTTFFNNLLPSPLRRYFYTKTNSDHISKDDKLSLTEFALICLEEIDSMKAHEMNQLKALVTTKTISERAAYQRFKENRRHIASFCGTGNNIRFLNDYTGNRRWLPFEVESISEPTEDRYHYEGLYAQALALWKSGFRYWFNQSEIKELTSHVENFEITSIEEELILTYYRKPLDGEECLYLSCANIVEHINVCIKQSLSPSYVGRALRKLGFEATRSNRGVTYKIIELSGAEIAMNKKYSLND